MERAAEKFTVFGIVPLYPATPGRQIGQALKFAGTAATKQFRPQIEILRNRFAKAAWPA